MPIALLDINDSNLQLWHEGTHLQGPGYALLAGGQYRFGNPARAAARLQPRDINTRYWWQLSTEPLQPALGPARHTGDLVHAQLQELHREGGQPGEVLMAVSGSMQRDQLALLLGIVQQCPFAAVGLINRSVAVASLYGGPGRIFHLEIQLHQALISELAYRDQRVELQRSVALPGCGLLQLQEKLVEMTAAAFIRQTRFDPRRKAATEQQLYDALPEALRDLNRETETNIEINGYRARVNRGELLAAGQNLFDSASRTVGSLLPDDRLIADPIAGLLPGLDDRFDRLEVLAGDSVRQALSQHLEQLVQRDEALSFVTALPCLQPSQHTSMAMSQLAATRPITAQPDAARPDAARPDAARPGAAQPDAVLPDPTHLLENHRARALQPMGTGLAPGWEIYRSAVGWQLRGAGGALRVNGVAHRQDQILRCGDAIRIDNGHDILLIEVAS
jgi:hypothetical protein